MTAVVRVHAGLIAVCALAAAFGAIGLGNESSVSLQGDMPRYLMNGVFLFDSLRDFPFSNVATAVEYAEYYYARYPALSLGHHPPLLSLAEVPMFAIFGVSVTSARVLPFVSFVGAVGVLYRWVQDLYGRTPAFFAAVFFATSPYVVIMGRSVLSEMPTLALVIVSAYWLHRFCLTERRGALVAFVVAAVLSFYAKQLAVFVVPAFLFTAIERLGVRRLVRRDMLIAATVIVLLLLPLVLLTLIMSRGNVSATINALAESAPSSAIVSEALKSQLALPVIILAIAGAVKVLVTRDRRGLVFVIWTAGVLAGVMLTRFEPVRYSIYWVPALCVLAASVGSDLSFRRRSGIAILAVLAAAASVQTIAAARVNLENAEGYEDAARFVLGSNPGPTVMFSGDVDSGYFTFFIRKHDPARRLVVLRSDKVLTTSRMDRLDVEERIERRDQIYDILRTFGTRFVVVEDRPSRARVLEWLREELRSARFVERMSIPIGTVDPRLRGTNLKVYEFLGATPPAADAVLSINLPLIGRSVRVKLSDLISHR